MEKAQIPSKMALRLLVFILLIGSSAFSQTMQLEVVGGAVVTQGSTITINAGASLDFRITNIDASSCKNNKRLRIRDVDITNTTDFDISPNNPRKNIKQVSCNGNGNKNLDFEIENINAICGTSAITDVIIEIRNQPDFTFTLVVNSSPVISVLGGTPSADIINGSTNTSAANGTYYGIVDEGATVIRNFIVSNTGSCPLEISSITASTSVPSNGFSLDGVMFSPTFTPLPYTASIDPGSYAIFRVIFTGPIAGSGTLTSTISISNNDNTTYTFDVSAEMFDYNIPGPGGITADFRLWLKATRGVTKDGSDKVSNWADIGTNGKDAAQATPANQPTYIDDATSNINFNPVIEFENNGSTISQYLYNNDNGFYSQDIFIVMESDVDVATSNGMTIFSGSISDILTPENYIDDADDVTGVGLGNYTTNLTGERLWYNQGSSTSNPYYALPGSTTRAYSTASIINAGNSTTTVSDGMRILYNSVDDAVASTETITTFENVGSVDTVPDPDVVLGTPYNIGRNRNTTLGNLNGRVAEIFTFAERVSDADRQKIESYLGIKYGITLGTSTEAQKDYINSFGTSVWDISANAGYNYHVAGIGKDSISDLNQKQSKTINQTNEVTIGLGGIFGTNTANTNEFLEDGDFLVWGSNDAAYTASGSNTVTITTGITTSLTRILRQWKIVESKDDVNGDVGNVFVSIPSAAFSGFTLATDEEYALVVADSDTFGNADIIDVIPLKSDGGSNLQTWYDFDGIKYFTFGKVSKLAGNRSVTITATDYLVGEYALNLNIDAFTISAWVKSVSSANTRTIMAKGTKLQLRLNASDQIEVMVDNDITPRFTSSMALNDGKWHQVTFVYKSGTIFLYVDGVLDKSEQNVEPPTPNFNRFSVGAVYIDKNTIINPFLGEIDEIYVWDQELTEVQVRYLMNQEIEKVTGDFVSGKIIPSASSSNEVATIPWSNLKAYYDFNSFYGSTVEGLTDERNFLRLKYLDKDKELAVLQTTPLPYVSAANGAWDTANTWSNNTDQVVPNSLSLDGTTIIDWNIVEIGHDITSGDRDISLLGLKQTAGTLTMADPGSTQDETNLGQALTISHYLEIDGIIDLVGESQLVQDEGSIIDADSGGFIERDQQGTANGFNYNYWSSSVGPITGNTGTRGIGISSTNANQTISGILNDGTTSSAYTSLTFDTAYTAADSNTPTTPRTLSTYWMYTFYGPQDDYYAWTSIDETSSLLPGEGFTMKGTSGSITIATNQNYVFKGLPNNGDITLPLDKSSGDVERLIGNPYPSAIDAADFILDNLSVADGGNNAVNVINGALYFWDHFGEENSHYLRDYVGGYATYNLTGGTAAISNDVLINNTSNAGGPALGTKIPGQYIPVNQGFFVSTALDGHFNDNDPAAAITNVVGGNIVFKNSQRVFVTEQDVESTFLRTLGKKELKSINRSGKEVMEQSSIRIIYDSPKGYHRQLLLGVNNNASKGFDLGYDAFMVDVNEEDMYWNINSGKFVIQGVDVLNNTQEFPLGLVVAENGVISIRIEELKNIDPSMSIYVKDKETEETFKINNEVFSLNLETGVYNDRFSLVFQQEVTVESSETEINHGLLAYYDSNVSKIKIVNTNEIDLNNLAIYNLAGQEISIHNINTSTNEIAISVSDGVYLLKFNSLSHGIINKKIIVKL